jgi:HsdM N-terminal domain
MKTSKVVDLPNSPVDALYAHDAAGSTPLDPRPPSSRLGTIRVDLITNLSVLAIPTACSDRSAALKPGGRSWNGIGRSEEVITGAIKSQVDKVWDAFWSGGISNPLEVIEQITYLLFLRRLDDMQILEENKATRLKKPLEHRIFPGRNDELGRPYEDMRWSRFRHFAPSEMFTVVDRHVFPFLRTLGGVAGGERLPASAALDQEL